MKKNLLFILIFLSGCASYKIPVQTMCHPASSCPPVTQVELSPILDIEKQEDFECQDDFSD